MHQSEYLWSKVFSIYFLFQNHRDASKVTATNIAQKAHELSLDPDVLSPFAVSAIDAGIDIRGNCSFNPFSNDKF